MIRRALPLLLLLLGLSLPAAARADSASTGYLTVVAQDRTVEIALALALRDLEDSVGLDSDADGAITWGELRAAAGRIAAYAQPRLRLTANGAACEPGPAELLADRIGGSGYAVLRYRAVCPVAIDRLAVAYSVLFDIDPRHRGLVTVTLNGAQQAGVFAPDRQRLEFGDDAGAARLARGFFAAGVSHLLGGADHLLFIAMLLAPALLGRDGGGTLARLIGVARLLTAFTAAHAVTLTLAVLGLVSVPASLAEPAIALTIVVTAADNLVPFLPRRREALALGFGLVHGLSVAGALGPLALPPWLLALSLLAFNLGIEATQLAIAAAAAPLCVVLRATPDASRRVLPMLSAAASIIAVLWLWQRLPPAVALATLLPTLKG